MTIDKQHVAMWLVLGICVGIRLVNISQPLVDKQYWRQTDTAAIARNFYTEGMNILYPRVDWRGDTPGYVESEFQLYPYLIAVLYKLFGPREIIGRLLSLLFAALSVWVLFVFVREIFDLQTAFYTALLYSLSPMLVHYTRAFMPESMLLFFYLLSLYTFYQWIHKGRISMGIAAWAATSLALMTTLTAGIVFLPMLAMLYDSYGWNFWKRTRIWVFFALSAVLPILWYWHAYHLFLETGLSFGILSGAGYKKLFVLEVLFKPKFWSLLLFRFFMTLLTPLGGIVFIISLILGFIKREITAGRIFLYVWVLAVVIYTLAVAEGIRVLEYYQLFLVPVAGIFIARGLLLKTAFSARTVVPAVYVVIFLSSLFIYARYYIGYAIPYVLDSYAFAGKIKDLSPPESLFAVIDSEGYENPNWYKRMKYRISSPSLFYYLNRKGWVIQPYELEAMETVELDEMVMKGARYFVAYKQLLCRSEKIEGLLQDLKLRALYENDKFILYDLRKGTYDKYR